ncbi:hypothetical protein GT354_31975 [Streptomyces sp. SID3343]|nr:hypothetical protein [Streptomyces sp. SID3343]
MYELVWPTPLFTAEAERISRSDHRSWVECARLLLGEAFAGSTAVSDFDEIGESSTTWAGDDPWSPKPPAGQPPPAYTQRTWLRVSVWCGVGGVAGSGSGFGFPLSSRALSR